MHTKNTSGKGWALLLFASATFCAQPGSAKADPPWSAAFGANTDQTAQAGPGIDQRLQNLQLEIDQLKQERAPAAVGNWHLQGSPDTLIPDFVSNDGQSYVRIIGRIQLDGTLADSPSAVVRNGQALPAGALNNTFRVRRARLGVQGQFDKNFIWKFEDELTSAGAASILDAYAGYQGEIAGIYNILVVGNQFPRFGFHTPSAYTVFLEEPLSTSAFRPGRSIGFTGASSTKLWNVGYGISTGRGPADTSSPIRNRSTFLATGQLAITPINQPGQLVRFSNSLDYNESDSTGAQFRSIPDAQFYGANLVSTPTLTGVRGELVDNPNVVLQYNQLAFEADYWYARSVESRAVRGSISGNSFSGWTAQVDYVLTGEVKPYDTHTGTFGGIKPLHPVTDGGWGAWQVAARADNVDLNDGSHGISGGRETNVGFALNWWPTAWSRVQWNYVKVLSVSGGTFNNYSPDIGLMRLQILW